jgi:lipoyl(octanoyl) transferase
LLGVDGQPLAENALGSTSDIAKIAALGIKVSRHFSYHGVALNVAMDLEPYARINACGYPGLRTVDMATLGASASWDEVAQVFAAKLGSYLQS